MKKKICIIFILFLFLPGAFLSLFGNDDKQNSWVKALAEKDPATKMQMLEEFKAKYGEDTKDKNLKFLYYNLAQTAMQLQQFEKVIEYGERTLTFEDVGDSYKLSVTIWLSNAYNLARKDLDKAYSYAEMCINIGNTIKSMTDKNNNQFEDIAKGIDLNYLAPALRIQIRIILARGIPNNEARLELIKKAINAYELDKSSDFPQRTVKRECVELARGNLINEAINSFEKVVDLQNLDSSEANFLAQLYYRKYGKTKNQEDRDKSTEFYEKSYAKSKDAAMALKIGQLLSKKDKSKALQYFADAYVIGGKNKETDAFKYLQQLWYKDIAKDQPPQEQEAGFKKVVDEATVRITGTSSSENTTAENTQQ